MIHIPGRATLEKWNMCCQSATLATRVLLPAPVVAGGAVRDTLLGRPVTDIDVFHEDELHGGDLQLTFADPYEEVVSVRTLPQFGPGVQFIQVSNLPGRLNNFSLNISRAFYTPDDGLLLSEDFVRGVHDKTLRFRHWASDQYKAKIIAKYQDWKIEVEQKEHASG